MKKLTKKNYIVKVTEDGKTLDEIKLQSSKRRIWVNRVDRKTSWEEARAIHEAVKKLRPKCAVLTLAKDVDIEIFEIED